MMPAAKGNQYTRKFSREDVIAIANDITEGLATYSVTENKDRDATENSYSEKKSIVRTGYSCLSRGLMEHRLYPQKLSEWIKEYKDDAEVSEALKVLKAMSDNAILANTADGVYSPQVGTFLCKTILGMKEVQVVQHTDKKYVCKNEEANDSK